MRVGEHIRQIREGEKNFKRDYIANCLKISTRAYANIENNVTDITIGRLAEIAEIFDCSIDYIINYSQTKKEFFNYFHNHNGNNNINIMNQSIHETQANTVIRLQEELLKSERNRIAILEALLRSHNINF
ncbi:helix-turn-helix transcriptional regulator [Algoriphagus sp. D3-2-R+10]|uniref:helix-turn-helix domain-containing protein n=1 Tax=Algoriphagus aurantiacus TaxID=3103948 RepID=UPI002B380DBA|nr:helix-turn-helix transcriptional regulator [Algoriphagus sp. D3-2-R+10]MEB2778617.1 helix-turn-helix transcriptional regulator [Algoriphagus sp. D3-2-R+10]